jgi:hypothetical protein
MLCSGSIPSSVFTAVETSSSAISKLRSENVPGETRLISQYLEHDLLVESKGKFVPLLN